MRKISAAHISQTTLHLLNGGYKNGDKKVLERVAGRAKADSRRVASWVVPKSAAIGDEVVINVGSDGLFATAKIASTTKPRKDWKNRYGADLEDIELIKPAISLAHVQRHIPDLKWARYPRSITTPSEEIAEQVRNLVKRRRTKWTPDVSDLSDAAIAADNLEELRHIARMPKPSSAEPKLRKVMQYARSRAVRAYVIRRSHGYCEWCENPAPFFDMDEEPFLESHHTIRIAEDGPDDPKHVIALCPNCHRRTECSKDKEDFNASLIRRLAELVSRDG